MSRVTPVPPAASSQDSNEATLHAKFDQPTSHNNMVEASPFQIVKTFPPRGELQQYRLTATTEFSCCHCQQQKKSKLVAIKEGKWDQLLCNGCYGLLLSGTSQNS
ncbi:hypothetical protein CONLIGDRAFT_641417 [Coniochaeta ligniaria NRRL 30616]|uniref:Uncharacterized protein n=1 Tax=Coniochaeta ligniaria NRRL 30616 TaxID=1408157 RepID=A0A1J7JQK5_9PEZI|nr:hypothetical protein CONLIGDRAFT_641417 [Coniochaeta ligniaria NRRL 30616]